MTKSTSLLLRFSGILLLLAAVTLGMFWWLMANPRANLEVRVAHEHLLIVTNVSAIALGVALLVARSALQLRQVGLLFIALGFMAMGGLFATHALATPGMIVQGTLDDYGGTVLGVSAFLSLFVPAVFFALAYSPLATGRREGFRPVVLVLLLAVLLVAYAVLSLSRPTLVAGLPLNAPPGSLALAGAAVLMLGYAGWMQACSFLASRLPMQGALVAAYLLLAEAQLFMVLAPGWTLAWWEYHVLMLLATVIAVVALFVELDRRRGLERFLPATVVARVVAGENLKLGGDRRTVTVLFADLRGSTTVAEHLPAEQVVELFNAYLGVMARAVFDHMGILDKFLGDGLMALFGLLDDSDEGGARHAIEAAQAIRSGIGRLNAERTALGLPIVHFGVGIHTGEAVVGAVGLPERSDYTAIGDAVNTASRLESACKEWKVDSVVSEDTARLLGPGVGGLQLLGSTAVRGRSQAVEVYTLPVGERDPAAGQG